MRHRFFTLAVLLFCLPSSARAVTTFVADINGASNVPPLDVPGSGTGIFILNDEQTELYFEITFSGLTGSETGAHIHNAGARDTGPIRFGLPLGSPKTGIWSIPPEMVVELFARRLYVNIHSTTYFGGELRGQILQQALPVEPSTWGAIKALFGRDRHRQGRRFPPDAGR